MKHVVTFIFFINICIPLFASDGELIGRICEINKSGKEITVQSSRAAEKISMGTKLYVHAGGKPVILIASFPMMTVAKCRINSGQASYFNELTKNMPVYLYIPGIEKIPLSTAPVHYDGLYQCKEKDYTSFLRFYSDGTVINVSSTGTAEQIIKWFKASDKGLSSGKYTVNGTSIKFSATSGSGVVDYVGKIDGDKMILDVYSHINEFSRNSEYTFIKVQ